MALIGIGLMGGSLVYAFSFDWRWGAFLTPIELMAVIILIRTTLKGLKRQKICLDSDQENYRGCSYKKECIGKEGIVIKDLKPSGVIEIDGEVYQALSEGQYIKRNTKVSIIGGNGSHLIVRYI